MYRDQALNSQLPLPPKNPQSRCDVAVEPITPPALAELGFPVVATSGNLSDEPICTDEHEASGRLRDMADVFLVHNRPIVRHVDDSVVRVMLDRELVLRRARGYAPLPIPVRNAECGMRSLLAVGAHLKNSIAFSVGNQVFLSQHIGDLETSRLIPPSAASLRILKNFMTPNRTSSCSDLHPDYLSTKFAQQLGGTPLEFTLQRVGESEPPDKLKLELQPQHIGVHIISRTSCPAWRRTKSGPRGAVFLGWRPVMALTARSGAANFSWSPMKVSNASPHLRPFRLPGGAPGGQGTAPDRAGDCCYENGRRRALGTEAAGNRWPLFHPRNLAR